MIPSLLFSPAPTQTHTHTHTHKHILLAAPVQHLTLPPPGVPPPPPFFSPVLPPSVPGHLVRGSLLCGTAADYVIISGPFWSPSVCVCVCVCVRLMKRGKGTHAKMTRACIRAADVSKQPPHLHTHTRFPISPADAKLSLLQSNLQFIIFLSSPAILFPHLPFLPLSFHRSIHPSSVLPPSQQLLALHPLLFAPPTHPHRSLLPPPTSPTLLFFLSLPPSVLLLSRCPVPYLPDSLAPFFPFCLLLSEPG